MISNYILTAWRSFQRNKLYTGINIFCLSVGITGAILIAMLLNHELAYDKYHADHSNIYLISGEYSFGSTVDKLAITPTPLGPAFQLEFSQVKNYVRFRKLTDLAVRVDETDYIEDNFFYADSTVFDVFTHTAVAGNIKTALINPHTAVLTQSTANRYFNEENPLGKILVIRDEDYIVTAVIEDLPDNSHLRFDALLSISTLPNAYSLEPNLFWSISPHYTYIQMHEGNSPEVILNNFDAFHEKYIQPAGDLFGAKAAFIATPLSETHFMKVPMSLPGTSKSTLLILFAVALFLVIIAAVNYTNLATAHAGLRAREIGVRKVAGATSDQIVFQFLAESILMSFLAMLISLLFVEILIPSFNTLADKTFRINNLFDDYLFLQVFLITLLVGLLAGAYPAFFLSQLNPAAILKSGFRKKSGPAALRKSLVILQFAISVMLVAGTITVRMQLKYLHEKDLGIEIDNRMALHFSGNLTKEKARQLENVLLQNSLISQSTKVFSQPGGGFNTMGIFAESADGTTDAKITINIVDDNFVDFFDIELLEGRNFNPEQPTDFGTAAIINEAAVEYLGWHGNALGKTIEWYFDDNGIPQRKLTVIGIMENHNYMDLSTPITPLMLFMPAEEDEWRSVVVNFEPGKDQQVRELLENASYEFMPGYLPNISYLHKGFYEVFNTQERMGQIFGIFALVCILLSFLGLFGLSSFLTEQRRREVGIRKVLGASGWGILALFYREFTLLIIIAIVVSAPLSWFLLDNWLQSFIYRIPMNIQPLLFASVVALFIAFITVSYHTIRAAQLNPADSIKAE